MPGYQRRRPRRRYSRRAPSRKDKIAKLVTGRSSTSAPMRMLRNGASALRIVPSLVKSVATIQSMINTELKFVDTNNTFNPSSSGTVSYLSGMATGTDDSERIGNSILAHDNYIRLSCAFNTSASATFVRIILICDKECDGVAPVVTNVLQTASPYSPLNQDFSDRFVVIWDKFFSQDPQKLTMATKKYTTTPFHIKYDGSTSGVASAKENNIFMLSITNEATNTPTIVYYNRFRYYDT